MPAHLERVCVLYAAGEGGELAPYHGTAFHLPGYTPSKEGCVIAFDDGDANHFTVQQMRTMQQKGLFYPVDKDNEFAGSGCVCGQRTAQVAEVHFSHAGGAKKAKVNGVWRGKRDVLGTDAVQTFDSFVGSEGNTRKEFKTVAKGALLLHNGRPMVAVRSMLLKMNDDPDSRLTRLACLATPLDELAAGTMHGSIQGPAIDVDMVLEQVF